ncbi:MAG TPA: sugar-binding domain-containing protein [Ktedonosporobacter sp.]|nr:sugar-binding domain-containing protein [Ktedonosporobacter sp.]
MRRNAFGAQESDDVSLLTQVASLYYEENYTQEQIARIIGTSRSGISRLLTRSRELGLVDIHVHHPLRTSAILREELIQQFGLQDAQVLLNAATGGLAHSHTGALAAYYLDRRIQESQIQEGQQIGTIGISCGPMLLETLKALRPKRRLPLNIVQLMGSIDRSSYLDIDGPEIARLLAEAYGAHCYYVHAPFFVTDGIVRNGLLQDLGLRRSFQMMGQMDMAVVAIGGTHPAAPGLFSTGYLKSEESQELCWQGVIGDICGHFFTLDGKLCETDASERMITVPLEALYKTPLVVGVADGAAKVQAIVGALRAGLVQVLITDEPCARAVLSLAAETSVA